MRTAIASIALALVIVFGAVSAFAEAAPATIHGAVVIGGKPRPDGQVSIFYLYPSERARVSAQTDAQGRYRFDSIGPGEILIGYLQPIHLVVPGRQMGPLGTFSYSRILQVEAGKDYTINFGGAGRKVLGRMVAPAASGPAIAWQCIPNRVIASTVKRPAPPKELSGAELDAWWKAYRRSSDNADLENSVQTIVFEVDKDGAFYADDVPPGQYRLEAQFAGVDGPFDKTIATVKHPFTVPDAPGAAPLDLGTIPVVYNGAVDVGGAAPDFSAVTFDGKPFKLSAYRGKYVLLNFWATWCEVCHDQLPLLQAIYDKWGHDNRFVMLGLSLDDDKATAAADPAMQKAAWRQALAGDPEKGGIAPQYGVYAVPEYFLIDPAGKLLVVHCYDPSIQSAVDKALAK